MDAATSTDPAGPPAAGLVGPSVADPMSSRDARRGRTHLVMLRHVLVAQDIALTLADADPDASVVLVGTVPEALAVLARIDALGLAFLAADPRGFDEAPLAQAVAARGGRLILIGQAAEAEGEALGYRVLARPFTSDAVTAFLHGSGEWGNPGPGAGKRTAPTPS